MNIQAPVVDVFPAPIARTIWDMKYRFRTFDKIHDETVQHSWRRVARALAKAESTEKERDYAEDQFYEALEGFRFLPAGRILAGAGTSRAVTLFNCFVMGTIPDDLAGIFQNLKEAALTMQQGGGIGYDFSTLRHKGAPVRGVSADASGPLSFMDVWDSMCKTIMSAGSRRGAMMATLRCDHPDIEAFVEAKRDPARLRMFNLSVLATDKFMHAIENDLEWPLHFNGEIVRVIRARELWHKMMKSTYEYAEPGVIFIDRINQQNNLRYCETISSSNPCGEQPLPPYGACLLGSINLTRMVAYPFTSDAEIVWSILHQTVRRAIWMLDNVIDVSKFALPEQEAEAKAKRRIGLGMTGLADALAMIGIPYGSGAAVAMTEEIAKTIALTAYSESMRIAKVKGPFPAFVADDFLAEGTFASRLPEDMKADIREFGIRNSHLTSIAPTGTISLYAGNISSGIEPIFALDYDRKVLKPDGSTFTEKVEDYAVKLWRDTYGRDATLPEHFVSAQNITPDQHVNMQAAAQLWVDSSISKTINVPEDIEFERFEGVYTLAFATGCKGCTTYRPNEVTGSILSVSEAEKGPEPAQAAQAAVAALADRPDELEGKVYKLKFPGDEHAVYVTLTHRIEDSRAVPFEMFINSKDLAHYAWTVALTRMVSAVFRRGGDVAFVADELKAVFDPKGGGWIKGRYHPSILALIGSTLEKYLIDIGYSTGQIAEAPAGVPAPELVANVPTAFCPRCSGSNYAHVEGCEVCKDCGFSSCG